MTGIFWGNVQKLVMVWWQRNKLKHDITLSHFNSIFKIVSEMVQWGLQKFFGFSKLEGTHLSGLLILIGIVLKSYPEICKCPSMACIDNISGNCTEVLARNFKVSLTVWIRNISISIIHTFYTEVSRQFWLFGFIMSERITPKSYLDVLKHFLTVWSNDIDMNCTKA